MTIRGSSDRRLAGLAALTFCLIIWNVHTAQAAGTPVTSGVNAAAAALADYSEFNVAESINNRARIYSQSGDLKTGVQGFISPISVAVDGSGRIYVGSKTGWHVAVYDSGLSFLFKVGLP